MDLAAWREKDSRDSAKNCMPLIAHLPISHRSPYPRLNPSLAASSACVNALSLSLTFAYGALTFAPESVTVAPDAVTFPHEPLSERT
jgi:hypothetical protein